MALEITNYIRGLLRTNPTAADQKKQGDDHIRLLKTALLNCFVGFPGTVLAGGTDTGVSNTYVLTPDAPLLAYSANMVVFWMPANTNGGASTINISSLGAQSIKRIDGTALANGDILAGNPVAMLYTGTEFRMVSVTKQYVDQLVFSGVLPGQSGNAGKFLVTNGTSATFSNAVGVAIDEAEGAPIAATSTLDLSSGVGTGNFTHITGAATINLMTLPGGATRTLVFDGVNTLTNSGSLILPTGANIVTAADDVAIVRGEGAGVVRVVSYTRKTGRALAEQVAPGRVLLATVAPALGAAVIDFLNVFSSTYDDYEVLISGLTARLPVSSVGSSVYLQIAVGGVADATNSYIGGAVNDTGGSPATNTAFQSAMGISADGVSTGACGGSIRIQNANGTTQFLISDGFSTASFSSNAFASANSGAHSGTIASGFRLLFLNSTQLAATGTVRVYGIRKT